VLQRHETQDDSETTKCTDEDHILTNGSEISRTLVRLRIELVHDLYLEVAHEHGEKKLIHAYQIKWRGERDERTIGVTYPMTAHHH
jgi:hypothetical protein